MKETREFRDKESNITIQSKKQLYLSLVRSQVLLGSVLWKPSLLKDITILERLHEELQNISLVTIPMNISTD